MQKSRFWCMHKHMVLVGRAVSVMRNECASCFSVHRSELSKLCLVSSHSIAVIMAGSSIMILAHLGHASSTAIAMHSEAPSGMPAYMHIASTLSLCWMTLLLIDFKLC